MAAAVELRPVLDPVAALGQVPYGKVWWGKVATPAGVVDGAVASAAQPAPAWAVSW